MRFWNELDIWFIVWHSLQNWPNYTMCFMCRCFRRYRSDESHILLVQDVLQTDLSYDEEPKAILAREVKQLRNK